MAQAERITTAIRELMSRAQAPNSTSLRAAHVDFGSSSRGTAKKACRGQFGALRNGAWTNSTLRCGSSISDAVQKFWDPAWTWPRVPA